MTIAFILLNMPTGGRGGLAEIARHVFLMRVIDLIRVLINQSLIGQQSLNVSGLEVRRVLAEKNP